MLGHYRTHLLAEPQDPARPKTTNTTRHRALHPGRIAESNPLLRAPPRHDLRLFTRWLRVLLPRRSVPATRDRDRP